MGKKPKNNSKRLKTSHKKALLKRKVINQHVSYSIGHLNKAIETPKVRGERNAIQAEDISFDELRKLIDGPAKPSQPKLKLEQVDHIKNLIGKWGENFERAAKDARRNKMQWTAKQVKRKAQAYQIMLNEEAQQQQ